MSSYLENTSQKRHSSVCTTRAAPSPPSDLQRVHTHHSKRFSLQKQKHIENKMRMSASVQARVFEMLARAHTVSFQPAVHNDQNRRTPKAACGLASQTVPCSHPVSVTTSVKSS